MKLCAAGDGRSTRQREARGCGTTIGLDQDEVTAVGLDSNTTAVARRVQNDQVMAGQPAVRVW